MKSDIEAKDWRGRWSKKKDCGKIEIYGEAVILDDPLKVQMGANTLQL